jgi:tryptophanase
LKTASVGIPPLRRFSGHAVFLDAKAMLSHISPLQYPGIGLVNELYVNGGIRGVEIGSVMFGRIGKSDRETPVSFELAADFSTPRLYAEPF